jgi:hypothetical protein
MAFSTGYTAGNSSANYWKQNRGLNNDKIQIKPVKKSIKVIFYNRKYNYNFKKF